MPDLVKIKRALISVSDKTDLVPFAKQLVAHGTTIISTGGTARVLTDAGIDVTPIDQVTQFPEMMDGRVKTLHPRVHGGLLAIRDNDAHVASMNEHGIEPIDLVCVNLYPFEKTVANPEVVEAEAIEQIDIGGPSMVRSAAKNHAFVAIVTDPSQYDNVSASIEKNEGATTFALRKSLCAAAFARTAAYDTAIADWMANRDATLASPQTFPNPIVLTLNQKAELRYGENPHQSGVLYADPNVNEPSVTQAKQLHGKELSFNNLYDANGALELVKEIATTQGVAAAVIKHANPCGFAVANSPTAAFENAYAGDPLAAFGGIVAFNSEVDAEAARAISQGNKFLEVIIAPSFADEALTILSERWKNIRILATGPLPAPDARDTRDMDYKKITGGLLIQQRDLVEIDSSTWTHEAGPEPSHNQIAQMRMAMITVKHLKSNAVCIVNNHALVGAGAGQMDRVASCRISIDKAAERAVGGVVGSDAFFPFRDGPDLLIASGIKAIAQPGGSKRDAETIAACNEAEVALMFTGRRHFRH